MAAGNTVIIKPSEFAEQSAFALATIINTNFNSKYIKVILGNSKTSEELLRLKFDKIFFTGSTTIGKIIYQAAAKNLTPVTLELGGKSPCFVLKGCNLQLTAKRLLWAKLINAGQTCVAPDYVIIDKEIEQDFLKLLKIEIKKCYKIENDSISRYSQIINLKHYDRVIDLIEEDNVFFGGNRNRKKRFISPTILQNVSFDDKIMQEEIFGPVIPVIPFTDLNEVISKVKKLPKPLSCYIYSTNKSKINKILNEISFGGGAINDSIMQLSNSNLPFGGVGSSGMGNYHGKAGFSTFSHYKSILHKNFLFEPPLKYPPYSSWKLKIIKWLME